MEVYRPSPEAGLIAITLGTGDPGGCAGLACAGLGSGVPELPEVECVRRSLAPHLVGAHVTSVQVARSDVVGSRVGRRARGPQPQTPVMRKALLEGATVARLDRRGKQLALIAEGDEGVIVHLGMSGRMTLATDADPVQPHTHVVWTLARARQEYTQVRFVDPRRFGAVVTFAHADALRAIWDEVGPDALALAGTDPASHAARETVAGEIAATRRAIKPTLLDQRVIAGVGNIYADEACFAARIDPHRPGITLTRDEIAALLDAVPRVLTSAIDCGGTTLRDYADALGGRGSAQARHAVYGRAGEDCLVCGGGLAADRLGQRATVWCPRCQR